MSEKYSTDELIAALNRKTRGYGFADIQEDEIDAIIAKLQAADKLCEVIMKKINSQAEDEALWFITASASEAYLQQKLRKLHRVSEKAIAEYEEKA